MQGFKRKVRARNDMQLRMTGTQGVGAARSDVCVCRGGGMCGRDALRGKRKRPLETYRIATLDGDCHEF